MKRFNDIYNLIERMKGKTWDSIEFQSMRDNGFKMDGVEYRFECAWYTWEFVRFVSYEGAVIIELTKEADSMKNRIIDAEETSLCYADDKETVKRLFED